MPRCACAQLRNRSNSARNTTRAPSGKPQAGRERAGGVPRVCRFRAPQTPNRFRQLHGSRFFSQIRQMCSNVKCAKKSQNRNAVWKTDVRTVVRSTSTGNGQYRWVLHCAPQILHELLTCRHVHTACHVGSGTRYHAIDLARSHGGRCASAPRVNRARA